MLECFFLCFVLSVYFCAINQLSNGDSITVQLAPLSSTSPPNKPSTIKINHVVNGNAGTVSIDTSAPIIRNSYGTLQHHSPNNTRRIVPSGMTMYEDDLSNIDVKSLVGIFDLCACVFA